MRSRSINEVAPASYRRSGLIISLVVLTLTGIFSVFFLHHLNNQMMQAFVGEEAFIPTRIYSDITKIVPNELRPMIEARLRRLGYSPVSSPESIEFQLHTLDYPTYLVNDAVSSSLAGNPKIMLHFANVDGKSILDSIENNGQKIQEVDLEPELIATLSHGGKGSEIREPLKLQSPDGKNEIPATVGKAIIAIEDQHFFEHGGFDPRGLARAIWVDMRTRRFAQGGSTITQQLVKNLLSRRTKNVFLKINELFLSLLLENHYSKEEILERYLNEVYLGQVGNLEVHGVGEGAEHFFGKKIQELNLAEIALMAGLIRGPEFYSPYRHRERAIERQHLVLRKMVETGMIAQAEMDDALKLPIRLALPQTAANKAPYFVDFVKAELIRQLKDRMSEQEVTQAGFRIYTTLDPYINMAAQEAVGSTLAELEKRLKLKPTERLEGALASVDQSTGFIRALIGGRSYAQSTFNRILNMKRQVGSTFKPFVYFTAIQKGADASGTPFGPAYPVEDAPWKLTFDNGRQTWAPKNYEKEYLGWISMRMALAHSINTVAAKLANDIGIQNVARNARLFGVDSPLPSVPSLALGVAELSPIELLRAYSVFANHGAQGDLAVIRAVLNDSGKFYAYNSYQPQQIFDAPLADLMTDLLTSVFKDGTAKDAYKMGFTRPAAGKTGTTSDHRDAWFAGYTPQLTTVVWVGFDQDLGEKGRPLLTGANAALPVWTRFMNTALAGEPVLDFQPNPEISDVDIDMHTGKRAAVGCPSDQILKEHYLKSRTPDASSCEPNWPTATLEDGSPKS